MISFLKFQFSAESERQDNNGSFPAGNIAISADYYWSQQVPGMEGKKLRIDGWRPIHFPELPMLIKIVTDSGITVQQNLIGTGKLL